MCCTLILQRSSLIMKGMMHAATSRRSRIRNGPSTRTRGDSAHLLLHCDAEGLGNNGAVDTGHDERGGQEKGSHGDNLTADCRTANGEGDAYLCPGVQASPSVRQAWERTSVAASFRVERADRIQVEECPERRAVSASSMWNPQRQTRRIGAECTDRSESGMSSSFAGGNCSARPCAAATWQDKGLMSYRNWKRRRKKTWRN